MDMRMKLGPGLTGAVIHAMGDRYDGTVAKVIEQEVYNKWAKNPTKAKHFKKTTLESVIHFADGKQVVLTKGMKLELIDRHGYESDDWVGRRIAIGSRRVERTVEKTGEIIVTWQKYLLPSEDAGHAVEPTPAWVTDDEPDGSDPIGCHDEDDSAPVRPFARRRG